MSAASDNMAGFGARKFMQDMYHQQNNLQAQATAGYDRRDHYYPDNREWTQSASAFAVNHRHYPSHGASSHGSHGSYDKQSAQPARDYRQADYTRHQHPASATPSAESAPTAAVQTRAPAPRAPVRSDTLLSSATDSTVGLAYAHSNDSAYGRDGAYQTNDSMHRSNDSLFPPQSCGAQSNWAGRAADRNTVYDDDYEEPVHSNTVDEMFRASSPASATRGDESTDVSFTIVRATVLEPDLPKAKCADCGDSLDFKELANHTCQPASASKLPLLKIQVPPPSSSSQVSSTATSPAIATPRSPFFDRYDHLVSQSGPASPSLLGAISPVSDTKPHDDETPTAHAVKILGTHAAVKVSHIKTSQPTHLNADRSPPVQPPPMQRSASDTNADAVARRKMIEQQRAAKKKDMMSSTMPRAATTPSLYKPEAAHAEATGATARSMSTRFGASAHQPSRLSASEGQHAKKESSSSSSISSTGTDSSDRQRAYVGRAKELSGRGYADSGTANITPSSSYERIEDGVGAARTSSTKPRSESHSTPTKPLRDRAPVDLSSIEEMMKGLTASPEPLQRMLADETRASLNRGRAATDAGRSERERALEVELERLRDKERTRQLQALRLKEKKRKERAAKRCCVCDCSLSSSRTPFVERDGKLLCARDWKELYLPKCRKCNLSVEKGAVKSSDGALRGVFHRACFSCAACEAPFADGSFYVFNNQPYCARHYHRLNGSLCRECERGIEGDCRQTDTGDRFHPHCFSCQYSSSKHGACNEPLAEYYMVGGQRLCERHADKVARRLAKAGQRQPDLRAHKRMTMLHSLR